MDHSRFPRVIAEEVLRIVIVALFMFGFLAEAQYGGPPKMPEGCKDIYNRGVDNLDYKQLCTKKQKVYAFFIDFASAFDTIDRYPKILAREVIRRNLFWFKEVSRYAEMVNLEVNLNLDNLNDTDLWRNSFILLTNELRKYFKKQALQKTLETSFSSLYCELLFDLGNNSYLNNDLQLYK
uniref:Uncharacterized protein n=1 Tax=Rhodnius prolixus TaxID=13249 RepID=T1I783_RHOPR